MKEIRAIGKRLDVSPEAFGELRASNDAIDDPGELRRRIAVDSYVMFRGLLPRDEVMAARGEVVADLARRGKLDPRHPPSEVRAAPGAKMKAESEGKRYPSVRRMLHGERISQLVESLLGGPIRSYDHIWMRSICPGQVTGPHCDIVYMGRGTDSLYTGWLPLGDVSLEDGPLLILEGSHEKRALIADYLRMDVDRDNNWRRRRWKHRWFLHGGDYSRNPRAVQREFGLRWLTTSFAAGDFVLFTAQTMHGSLDNRSGRIRLSADTRYQLASDPIDERWIGEHPIGHSQAQ